MHVIYERVGAMSYANRTLLNLDVEKSKEKASYMRTVFVAIDENTLLDNDIVSDVAADLLGEIKLIF